MSAVYDSIGETYTASRRADPPIAATLAALLGLKSSGRYLDVACGTGNYTAALSGQAGTWTGIDVSVLMLSHACQSCSDVTWLRADAATLPFRTASFDGATCTLAVHHFSDLDRPLCEVRRVLRSGSLVLFTAFPEQMRKYWLCHYFPSMMQRSIEKMPSEDSVREALSAAGFSRLEVTPYCVAPDLEDLFLYSGKDRPDLYLQASIRANISSFASLATSEEIDCGVVALERDVSSGRFREVQANYNSSGGDYAFVAAYTAA